MRNYTPGNFSGSTVDALRSWVATELSRLARTLSEDEAPVGDTRPGSNEVGLLIYVNRAGTVTQSRVLVGPADSAGVGYRALRVEN